MTQRDVENFPDGPPDWLDQLIVAEGLPPTFRQDVARVYGPVSRALAGRARNHGPGFIAGICGAQGSGKSTVAQVLQRLLEEQGLSAAIVSLDDLYLPRQARERLAREVHPLLAVRGPPGTHDVQLGLETFDALGRPGEIALPRFDKVADTRRAHSDWPRIQGPIDVVLFEGWCVGARPQSDDALRAPINPLERDQDPRGVWRAFVNAALAGDYQQLFSRLNLLIPLKAPGFEVVRGWRAEQEAKLRERLAAAGAGLGATMSEAEIGIFVQHYERITRHNLEAPPAHAEIVIHLDPNRRPDVLSL